MKCLATCKPSEFVAQTAKIKGAVAHWLDAIELMKIRNIQPNYEPVPLSATVEERAAILKRNGELQKKQAMENLGNILDKMLVEHPKETLDVLALCCFVEPEHVDDYTIDEYFECIMQMMQNKSVTDFFSFLAQLKTVANTI